MPVVRRPTSGEPRERPLRLYALVLALLLLVAYAVAFVVANGERVEVDFVFADTRARLIWLVLLSLLLGLVCGVVLAELSRRSGRKERREAGDALGDLPGRDEAEGKPG